MSSAKKTEYKPLRLPPATDHCSNKEKLPTEDCARIRLQLGVLESWSPAVLCSLMCWLLVGGTYSEQSGTRKSTILGASDSAQSSAGGVSLLLWWSIFFQKVPFLYLDFCNPTICLVCVPIHNVFLKKKKCKKYCLAFRCFSREGLMANCKNFWKISEWV